jgi:peptidyl-prolyl cis-trans isomerase D
LIKKIGGIMSETKKKTFRERLLGWGVKVLLALLILSFGVWGIGDYVAPQQANVAIATVGKSEISIAEFQNEVQFQVSRLRAVLGDNFTEKRARAMGVTENVLNSLIQRKIFAEGANEMGLVISDDLVSREIRDDDRFKSQSGTFDRLQFNETIQRAGLNEDGYISLYKRQLLQDQFLSSIYRGQSVPKPLVASIYKFRNEKRSLNFIEIKHSSILNIPKANEEVLKKFHKDNSRQFTAPEFRAITLVQIQIKDIIDEIDVSDKEVQEAYDDRINEFKTPETRKIQQILVADKKKSDQIYDKITAGVGFIKVAKDLANLGSGSLELGTLNRSQIPIKELADTAFSILENTISTPVKSPLGWHILRVTKIKPAKQRMLVEVKAELKKIIAAEKAVDALYNLSNKYEDELGSGLTIEEAAKRLNFKIRKIPAINAEGRNTANKKIINLNPAIVQVAFNTEQDQDSALTDFGDSGYFILHVNGIKAPALRPFKTIISNIESVWLQKQQAIVAEKRVQSLINRLKGSATLADIAKELNIGIQKSSEFLRTGAGLNIQLPGRLISALFKAKGKEFVSGASNTSSFIGQIQAIKLANQDSDKKTLAVLKQQLLENIMSDMSTQLTNALRKKLGVSINNAAVASAF